MRDSTVLPELCMLPSRLLVPHEDYDPRRIQRLGQRIMDEGILKNPPIVAAIPDNEQYVILDGANRGMAFKELKIPHIVAQVVSYVEPAVIVDTWYHVVSGMPINEFEKALCEAGGLQLEACSLEEARQALERGQAQAYIVCADGVRKVIRPGDKRVGSLRELTALVNTYRGRADIFRASNDIWEKQIPYYPEITALVIFPRCRPEDILHAAQNSYRVPSGITRHIIANRAVNINIPLWVLMADWPLERKRDWLDKWLMERMAGNSIRFYAESTFSFNE